VNKRFFTFEGFILFVVIVLTNLRALIFFTLYPETGSAFGSAWIEIGFWILAGVGVGYLLVRDNLMTQYFSTWRMNWVLGIFIIIAFISALWSLDFSVTVFRALELLFATLIASDIGIRYRSDQLMTILFWFGAFMLIFSIALVFGAPPTGTMPWVPFNGAWRGVYWHRNHLSSITALVNIVYFFRAIMAVERRDKVGYLDGFLYILSLVVLYFAESATGYILFILLHLFVICAWLWDKINDRLQTRHYYVVGGLSIIGLALILSNLDVVFGLFDRTTTLTGRVGLWDYLLKNVVSERLWWGHGFGAIWALESVRESVRQGIGWYSQPVIADNGYIEILLQMGILGLFVFLSILIAAVVRTFRYALSHKTLTGFFPALVMFYAIFANIAFSLFAETEIFVWFLIVAVLFMVTPPFLKKKSSA